MIDVYLHTSPSGRQYVGVASKGMAHRWLQHTRDAARGSDFALHRAIRKYGAGAFTSQVLERMSTEAGAMHAEKIWIRELGTMSPAGYNLTSGGDGAFKRSPETIAKMAEAARHQTPEKRARIGAASRARLVSAETRAKMSASFRGRQVSEETRAKIAVASAGRKHTPEACAKIAAAHAGRPKTAEHRANMSRAGKGKVISPEWRLRISAALSGVPKPPGHAQHVGEANRRRVWTPESRRHASDAAKKRLGK